jgi:hypothetical protein
MVATIAKIAKVARKENLAKIGMRSFFNKVGAPIYTDDSKGTRRRGENQKEVRRVSESPCLPAIGFAVRQGGRVPCPSLSGSLALPETTRQEYPQQSTI